MQIMNSEGRSTMQIMAHGLVNKRWVDHLVGKERGFDKDIGYYKRFCDWADSISPVGENTKRRLDGLVEEVKATRSMGAAIELWREVNLIWLGRDTIRYGVKLPEELDKLLSLCIKAERPEELEKKKKLYTEKLDDLRKRNKLYSHEIVLERMRLKVRRAESPEEANAVSRELLIRYLDFYNPIISGTVSGWTDYRVDKENAQKYIGSERKHSEMIALMNENLSNGEDADMDNTNSMKHFLRHSDSNIWWYLYRVVAYELYKNGVFGSIQPLEAPEHAGEPPFALLRNTRTIAEPPFAYIN